MIINTSHQSIDPPTFRIFKIYILCTLLCFCQPFCTFAQDTSHIRISLLTCTPGEDLYSTFGHTAIRVTDTNSVADVVFNYGTFNFEDPGFYTKFIRGKLMYYLSTERFDDFKADYQFENRGITEQLLNLDAAEKIAITAALYKNIQPQNRTYQYEFFFDNCTTRPRDLLIKYKKNPPAFKPVMPPGTRFRQAIHQYLDTNQMYWSKLGIDLLLGAPTDAVMTTGQSQFLPDNLMKTLDSSANGAWVLTHTSLYPLQKKLNNQSVFTPLTLFSIFSLLIFLIGLSNSPLPRAFIHGFDGIFFFFTGAVGLLLVFMWAGTDHAMCKQNYNLLWAWPMHIVMAFWVRSTKAWARLYFKCTAIALVILLLAWAFLPQQMNTAFVPLVLLLAYRGYKISLAK